MTHSAYLAILARCWQRWPDMRRYEATAQRGGLRFDERSGVMVWSEAESVTVTCFDKRQERQGEYDERIR